MIISNRDRVSFAVVKVFEAARDHTADHMPYLPDIQSVEVIERKEMEGNKSLSARSERFQSCFSCPLR